MALTRPTAIVKPFADNGDKNVIPLKSLIGITPGAPSLETGFPPLTSVDPNLGGVPVKRADFNGIFNLITQHVRFTGAGGRAIFDADLATEIGGYPVGVILQDNAGVNSYINVLAGNTVDFNTTPASIGVSWFHHSGKTSSFHAASGYQKFSNGLIVQWGSGAVGWGTLGSLSFPIAFPTVCFTAVASVANLTAGYAVSVGNLSTTQIQLFHNAPTNQTINWVAIGG